MAWRNTLAVGRRERDTKTSGVTVTDNVDMTMSGKI